jgi:sulfoquinovosidase
MDAPVPCGRFLINCTAVSPGRYYLDVYLPGRRAEWSLALDPGRPFVSLASGNFAVKESMGNFAVTDQPVNRTTWQTVDVMHATADSVTLSGRLGFHMDEPVGSYNLSLQSDGSPSLKFCLQAEATIGSGYSPNRAYLSWFTDSSEQFFGLGEQYSIHGLRGRRVPIFTTEQGVGRGLQPLSKIINSNSPLHNAAGNWHTTYTAIGHYVSSHLRSVAVHGTGYTGRGTAPRHCATAINPTTSDRVHAAP